MFLSIVNSMIESQIQVILGSFGLCFWNFIQLVFCMNTVDFFKVKIIVVVFGSFKKIE
jgi:hypothetical protein